MFVENFLLSIWDRVFRREEVVIMLYVSEIKPQVSVTVSKLSRVSVLIV